MVVEFEKEWAAVDGDEIVVKRDTKGGVIDALRDEGFCPDRYDIVAFPANHRVGSFL